MGPLRLKIAWMIALVGVLFYADSALAQDRQYILVDQIGDDVGTLRVRPGQSCHIEGGYVNCSCDGHLDVTGELCACALDCGNGTTGTFLGNLADGTYEVTFDIAGVREPFPTSGEIHTNEDESQGAGQSSSGNAQSTGGGPPGVL